MGRRATCARKAVCIKEELASREAAAATKLMIVVVCGRE